MAHSKHIIFNWLVFFAFLFLVGCNNHADYDIVLRNVSNKTIRETHVGFEDFRSIGGILVPKSEAVEMSPGLPIPGSAVVEWRSQDGVMHREEVAVKSTVPENFTSGLLIFEISDDGVKLTTEPRFSF